MSGKLPGGLHYVRAALPASMQSEKRSSDNDGSDGGPGSDGEDGPVSDRGGRRGGADGDGGGVAKSFTTGAIAVGGGVNKLQSGEEDNGPDSGVAGDYCMVRVDSLDRVSDVIYCGREAVEAKNLSKVVGVQLGYLQARIAGEKMMTKDRIMSAEGRRGMGWDGCVEDERSKREKKSVFNSTSSLAFSYARSYFSMRRQRRCNLLFLMYAIHLWQQLHRTPGQRTFSMHAHDTARGASAQAADRNTLVSRVAVYSMAPRQRKSRRSGATTLHTCFTTNHPRTRESTHDRAQAKWFI